MFFSPAYNWEALTLYVKWLSTWDVPPGSSRYLDEGIENSWMWGQMVTDHVLNG